MFLWRNLLVDDVNVEDYFGEDAGTVVEELWRPYDENEERKTTRTGHAAFTVLSDGETMSRLFWFHCRGRAVIIVAF
jgi:hypothetical protein